MGRIIDRRRVMAGKAESPFIQFADPTMKSLCVALWGGADGGTAALNTRVNNVKVAGVDGELTYEQAASIKSIAANQFKSNTTITSFDELQYFTGLTTIGGRAFQGCSLVSIAIPSSITSIGDYGFMGCSSLAAVHISDLEAWCNITFGISSNPLSYGYHHLYLNGEEIKDLVIPNTITTIKAFAFVLGTSFTSVTIPNSVTSIGIYSLSGCSGLQTLNIPDSVTTISMQAFKDCKGLTSITIPDSVTNIGDMAFYNCSSLTSIVVDSDNTVYDSRNNCNAIINTSTNELIVGSNSTVIPNTVVSICSNAFSHCSGLTSVTIHDSITNIGGNAFEYCSGLTSVIIGSGVTSIGSQAFRNCTRLTSIDISSGVTSIGDYTFFACSSLTSIKCDATTAPTIYSSTFNSVKINGTLTVPSGSTGYDVWMGTDNYYLGKYNWTKVEQ